MGVAGPTVKTSFRTPPYLSIGGVVVAGVDVAGGVVVAGVVVAGVVVAGVVVVGVVVVGSPQATSPRPDKTTNAIKINNAFFILCHLLITGYLMV